MVTIKDGCGCDPCDCDWKQKVKEAYSRAIQSVNKIGDETGRVYFPDGTGFVKMPLPTKEQIDSIAEIDGIKASVDSLNITVPALEEQVTGVTESLVSDVEVLNGTTAGKFKVRIEREKAALIDSNDYDLSKVNSIELIQGSGPAMVKAQLTLSDGTVLRSDDFLFTSESIGTDVYISSFTFKNGNVDGTISADIGLNNGTTLEANNFVVPTDPSVVSTITDLQTRTEALEQNVIDISKLKTDVNDMKVNKADVTNAEQIISSKRVIVDDVRFNNEAQGFYAIRGSGLEDNPFMVTHYKTIGGQTVEAPIGHLALLGSDRIPTNFKVGDVWEEVDLSNPPLKGELTEEESFKIQFKWLTYTVTNSTGSWTGALSEGTMGVVDVADGRNVTIEFSVNANTVLANSIPLTVRNGNGCMYSISIGNLLMQNPRYITLYVEYFNGNGYGNTSFDITVDNLSTYVKHMWRLKK